jgi:phosphate starvation-inducible PhoH-like protein
MTKKHTKSFTLPKALTKHQQDLIQSICTKEMTLVTGFAGTGKSFLPAAYAAYFYAKGIVDRIVLTRPTVPVGKGLGFLPGDVNEKMEPWVAPFVRVLEEFLSKGEIDCMLKNLKLEVVPFDVIRGRTFDNSFIVLDEAQNTTIPEIKAFVTRIGKDSKTVINGDINQSDLKTNDKSGLAYLTYLLEDIKNEELANKVGLVHFGIDDCVRGDLCKLWLKAFE